MQEHCSSILFPITSQSDPSLSGWDSFHTVLQNKSSSSLLSLAAPSLCSVLCIVPGPLFKYVRAVILLPFLSHHSHLFP